MENILIASINRAYKFFKCRPILFARFFRSVFLSFSLALFLSPFTFPSLSFLLSLSISIFPSLRLYLHLPLNFSFFYHYSNSARCINSSSGAIYTRIEQEERKKNHQHKLSSGFSLGLCSKIIDDL